MGGEAYLSHVVRSEFGKLGIILIPVCDVDLFKDKQCSLDAAVKGVELAAARYPAAADGPPTGGLGGELAAARHPAAADGPP